MLLSKQIKLVAAFNHMHIFIDPNPDPKTSFAERQRLFTMPSSQWIDYNSALISQGGGVFLRSAKSITLTPEMKKLLNIDGTTFTPDQLIQAILKAEVDLLWNGGIGTYVKAISETNEMIADKANDPLRINGSELQCKVVGEGGNLGFTQLGRIEYALKGGRINTDFIDNSAGVDCSDHEVNIKIALAPQILSGKLSLAERDKILMSMTDEVAALVLKDNYAQSLLISIEQSRPQGRIDDHSWLINYLTEAGELNRKLEYLPGKEEMRSRAAAGQGLTRPELAVLVAYAKNSISKQISQYNFMEDPVMVEYLRDYFPSKIKGQPYIEDHQLRNQIIATILTNDMVNMMGCSIFHQLLDNINVKPASIIKAFVVVRRIFNIDQHWREVEKLDGEITISAQLALYRELQAVLERNTMWMLYNYGDNIQTATLIEFYQKRVSTLMTKIYELANESFLASQGSNLQAYQHLSEEYPIVQKVLAVKLANKACDIVKVADENSVEDNEAARVYFMVGEKMGFTWVRDRVAKSPSTDYLENVVIQTLLNDVNDVQMQLVAKELHMRQHIMSTARNQHACCIIDIEKTSKYNNFLHELKYSPNQAVLPVLNIFLRRVKEFL
jgi:glutamate dehydrogenase